VSIDDRGQAMGDPLPIVFVVITVIALYVGYNVMEAVANDIRQSPGSIEHLCAGLWGCTGPSTTELSIAVALVVTGLCLAVMTWYSRRRWVQ